MQEKASRSTTLCKACGLCCTGHLFFHTEIKPIEVGTTDALGLAVLNTKSGNPVFCLPCPLWNGQCTVYTHPHKPSRCADFKCKLLREVEEEQLGLDDALTVIQRTKQLIEVLEAQLPPGPEDNFRKRLVESVHRLEQSILQTEAENTFRLKVGVLLVLFVQRFGVTDLFNRLIENEPLQE